MNYDIDVMTPVSQPRHVKRVGDMATIYDVAKKAEVSPKTVSRVLNGDAPVNEKTRAKVMQAMDALGYVPSQAARMMRSNRSGIIGLITGAISRSPEPTEPTGLPDLYIVQAVQKEMSEQGKILMIADTGDDFAAVPALARSFAQHRVEGLIYVADYHREVELDLGAVGCPVVLINCFDALGTRSILPDDRACQMSLVSHLIQSGHRQIGFLTLDPAMPASGLRTMGFADAFASAGLSHNPELVIAAHQLGRELASEILTEALDRLLALPTPPTAICCGNDEMAMRVYGILRSRGLRVPEDISVAGFDDHRMISETLYPPLSTVQLPYREMGRYAANSLLQMIGDQAAVSTGPTRVSGPVIWRSSVTALNSVRHLTQGRNGT